MGVEPEQKVILHVTKAKFDTVKSKCSFDILGKRGPNESFYIGEPILPIKPDYFISSMIGRKIKIKDVCEEARTSASDYIGRSIDRSPNAGIVPASCEVTAEFSTLPRRIGFTGPFILDDQTTIGNVKCVKKEDKKK